MRHQNNRGLQELPAVLIEVDRKGYFQRYALTPKEFHETFAERLQNGMPKSQDKWQNYELRPMVHMWYCEASVGDDLWNTFFTDMEYGLSEGDIESGNLAYIERNEMQSLSQYLPNMECGTGRTRLFIDMDGTLAVFTPVDEMETLYQEGYFLNQKPHENVVEGVRLLMTEYKDIDVYILSSYLTDSKYALNEKNEWLDRYLPEIDTKHRIFVPYGKNKADWIEGGIDKNDYLLDDYTKNLHAWAEKGSSIKLLNAINGSRGTWNGDKIRFDRSPENFTHGITNAIQQGIPLRDKTFSREEMFLECRQLIFDMIATKQYREDLLGALEGFEIESKERAAVHEELNHYLAAEEDKLTRRRETMLAKYPELKVLFDENANLLFAEEDSILDEILVSERKSFAELSYEEKFNNILEMELPERQLNQEMKKKLFQVFLHSQETGFFSEELRDNFEQILDDGERKTTIFPPEDLEL